MLERTVFFYDGWLPYGERGTWMAEAAIGVSAHFDNVETRYAYRTRVLDYLWAGLPVVTTTGDAVAEMVARHGLGRVVGAGDVQGWVDAIDELLDVETSAAVRDRVASIRASLTWDRASQRLADLLSRPGRRVERPGMTRAARVNDAVLRMRLSHELRGTRGFVAHGFGRVRRGLSRRNSP
jgi:glycosyltransferase involved in cell wall biosynthesis